MRGLAANHVANARYRVTRADISVYFPMLLSVIAYMLFVTLTTAVRHGCLASASYLFSIRDILPSPGAGLETNYTRQLHADTTTTAGL